MTPKFFIEKAIIGGWNDGNKLMMDSELVNERFHKGEYEVHFKNSNIFSVYTVNEIVLDPLAWQAVGKVKGWTLIKRWGWNQNGKSLYCDYEMYMHRMIDALIEGKTIEEFLETL